MCYLVALHTVDAMRIAIIGSILLFLATSIALYLLYLSTDPADRRFSSIPNIPPYPNARMLKTSRTGSNYALQMETHYIVDRAIGTSPKMEQLYRATLEDAGWQHHTACRADEYRIKKDGLRYVLTFRSRVQQPDGETLVEIQLLGNFYLTSCDFNARLDYPAITSDRGLSKAVP